jgi:hypothetical protein
MDKRRGVRGHTAHTYMHTRRGNVMLIAPVPTYQQLSLEHAFHVVVPADESFRQWLIPAP